MNRAAAHLLTLLYPRSWRARYGEEFEALLEAGSGGLGVVSDVVSLAVCEYIFRTQGGDMERDPGSFGAIVRHPSALIPMAMSLVALALVIGPIPFHGIPVREADEGAVAHIWQILMAGQLPVLAFFAIRWLPRAPKPAMCVLAMQAGAVLASMAPVFYFNL